MLAAWRKATRSVTKPCRYCSEMFTEVGSQHVQMPYAGAGTSEAWVLQLPYSSTMRH